MLNGQTSSFYIPYVINTGLVNNSYKCLSFFIYSKYNYLGCRKKVESCKLFNTTWGHPVPIIVQIDQVVSEKMFKKKLKIKSYLNIS